MQFWQWCYFLYGFSCWNSRRYVSVTMGGAGRELTDKELSGGIVADGIGASIASIFGILPTTSFSQNTGIVTMTKVMSRYVVGLGTKVF